MIYACTHVSKEVQVDHFEDGCTGQTSLVMDQSCNHLADTLKGLLTVIKDAYALEPIDSIFIPDESQPIKYVGWNRLENDEGSEPTPREMEDFKALKRTLFLADWCFWIECREVHNVTVDDFKAAGISTH